LKVSENPKCDGCPLRQKFPDRNFIPTLQGRSLRLVVAEAGGQEEEQQGTPLVGGSGRRLDALARRAGLRREDLTLANTLSCRPLDNLYPTDPDARSYCTASEGQAIVEHCYKNHLLPLLKSRPWQRIDILGDKALKVLTGLTGIMRYRGTVVPIKDLDGKLIGMPTLHPAFVSRNQVYSKVVIADLSKNLTLAPENYNLYPSLEDVQKFDAKTFALDIETKWGTEEITVVGLCAKEYTAMVVPFRGAYKPEIKRILLNAEQIIGQNLIQFDLPILCRALEIEYP
jgi:uracil-DNA glycosylase family 4